MKEFKGTQGEWEIRSEYGSVGVSYEGDRFYYSEICKIDYLIHGSKELANAKLIAAAPELLAACQEFVRKCDEGKTKSTKSYQQMKAAIEKAL